MTESPQIAKLLSAGRHKLNFFVIRDKIKVCKKCVIPMKDVYKRNILVHIKKLSGIKLLGVTLGSNPTY